MRRITLAILLSGALIHSASATVWHPVVPVKPVPSVGTSSAAGAGAVTGFLAFVAALALYDIQRRWTCSGDYLGLGGPGFNEPMKGGNVKAPPNCGRKVVRVKG